MHHEDCFFPDSCGESICAQAWLPDGEPRAALLLVHGLAEHCGRYANLLQHLVPRGFALFGHDHVGHGRSTGPRAYVRRFDDYIATLHAAAGRVRERLPGKPLFLVGHSLGGLIGAVYLLDHPEGLAGAVLSGPLVSLPPGISPATLLAAKLLSALAPRAGLQAVEAAGVSRDPAVVEAYVNDPLVYRGKTTARLAAEMLKAIQRVQREEARIALPLLLVHGGEDRLVDPAGTRRMFAAVASTDKKLIVYEGLHHEVYNEPEHPIVLSDVATWLEAHLPAA